MHVPDCAGSGKICVEIPLAEALKMDITDNGDHFSIGMAGCDFDSIMAYTVSNLFGQGALGPYFLEKWEVNGQVFKDTFQDIPALVALMNGWDTQGNWVWNSSQKVISGGRPGSAYSSMDVTVLTFNTPSSIGFNLGFDPRGTELSFKRGFHEIVLNDTIGGRRDTFFVHVSCSDRLNFLIKQGDTTSFCFDFQELLTAPVSIMNTCASLDSLIETKIVNNGNCVQIVGKKWGVDESCWVACDATGFCDTTFVRTRVLYPGQKHSIFEDLPVGETRSFCFDTMRLNGLVKKFETCDTVPARHVDFYLNQVSRCVEMTGRKIGGVDTSCAVICDELGVCDTMIFYARVLASKKAVRDTIFVGDTSGWCPNLSYFFGDTITVENFCQNSQGASVTFDINPISLCLEISALAIGTDTACLSICDEFGACDTATIIITAIEPPRSPLANPDQMVSLLGSAAVVPVLDNDIIYDTLAPVSLRVLDAVGLIGPLHGVAEVDSLTQNIVWVSSDSAFCNGAETFNYEICQNGLCDTALVTLLIQCLPPDTSSQELVFFNGFSPNDDQVNDFFVIRNVEKWPGNRLEIFTRWGLQIFEKVNYDNTWNGFFNDQPLPDGVYFYLFEDGKGGQHRDVLVISR